MKIQIEYDDVSQLLEAIQVPHVAMMVVCVVALVVVAVVLHRR